MAHTDQRGLSISTDVSAAAEHYREGVDLMLAAWPGAAEALDAAIEADPDFALAQAGRGRLDAMLGQPAEARARLALAVESVARRGSERERSHVEIISLVVHGEPGEALRQILTHLDDWPRDALILSMPLGAFGLYAFSGMADHDQARIDLCNRHARHYDAQDWWFLTSRGWAEAENGDVSLGRDMLQQAHDLRRDNANTVHAWAHALFEAGAGEEGEALISGWLPDYPREGVLHGHLAWHAALIALERGETKKALELYGRHVQPSVNAGLPINVVSDAASLLWRIEAYGHKLSPWYWPAVADYAGNAFPRPGHAFIDSHMALIEAATGRADALRSREASLTAMVEAGALGAGPVVPAICRAVLAFAQGDNAACAEILEPILPDVARIGGSGAQREVIEDTLLAALMRNGQACKARALLDHRLHRRPSPRDERWRVQMAAEVG